MSKFLFISPNGVTTPSLYDTFEEPFVSLGHQVVNRVGDATCVFFDLHARTFDYDMEVCSEVLRRRLPVVIFDLNTDYGAMSKERWPGENDWAALGENSNKDWAKFLHGCLQLKLPMVYFMWKMDKTIEYPKYVFPIDLLMYPDHDFRVSTQDELFTRPFDICWIGNVSPTRKNFVTGLIESNRFKIYSYFTTERLPHEEWLKVHRQAKLFISADGGGFGDERPYQLTNIAAQLRNRNNQRFLIPPIDLVDCIEADEHPTKEDIEKIEGVLKDKYLLYEIYTNGVERMRNWFNPTFRSHYVLKVLTEMGMI